MPGSTAKERRKRKKKYPVNTTFLCSLCNKQLKTHATLSQHMKNHSTPMHKCFFCPATFHRLGNLQRHWELLHMSDTPYNCYKCGKNFPCYLNLQAHLKTHKSIYFCNVCSASFKKIGDLNKHLVCHKDGKDFVCHVCSSRFNRKCSLKRHLNKIHNLII